MADPSPIITLKNVCRGFHGRAVLRDISLEFPEGLTTVVIGPSGCGKSVMLKHIIGLLRPDSGEIWFGEHRIDTTPEKELSTIRRRFGMLFQQSALFDSMSVRENVAFAMREVGWENAKIDERVNHVLSLVGLSESVDKLPAELSGGMRKRVGLARAIVLDPEVILYDEPTTGLDPIRADVINELVLRLKDRLGVTSILVTHDLVSAYKVADHMVLLHNGRVHLAGTPEVFRQSTDPIVLGFLEGRAESAALLDTPHDEGTIDDTEERQTA